MSRANARLAPVLAAATPKDAVARLEEAATRGLQAPPVKERLVQIAAEPVPVSSSEFQKYFNDDVERFAKLVREGKLKPLQ